MPQDVHFPESRSDLMKHTGDVGVDLVAFVLLGQVDVDHAPLLPRAPGAALVKKRAAAAHGGSSV